MLQNTEVLQVGTLVRFYVSNLLTNTLNKYLNSLILTWLVYPTQNLNQCGAQVDQ